MSHTDEPLPTVREELERKTVELLESLVHRHETNRVSDADLRLAAHTLWTVTSGLVSNSVSELCSLSAQAGKAHTMSRNFIGKGKLVTVLWKGDGNGYLVVSRDATTLEKKVQTVTAEVGFREDELKKLFGVLARSGYSHIST